MMNKGQYQGQAKSVHPGVRAIAHNFTDPGHHLINDPGVN